VPGPFATFGRYDGPGVTVATDLQAKLLEGIENGGVEQELGGAGTGAVGELLPDYIERDRKGCGDAYVDLDVVIGAVVLEGGFFQAFTNEFG